MSNRGKEEENKPISPIMVEAGDERISLAEFYHRASSYPAAAHLAGAAWKSRPPVYKEYRGAPGIPLPAVKPEGGGKVIETAGAWRAGCGRPAMSSMTLDELSLILFNGQGVTKTMRFARGTHDFRAAPSAGALYPVDLYVVANRVAGLEPGLYHYDVKRECLEELRKGLLFGHLEAAAGSPSLFRPAAAAIVATVTFGRTGCEYQERAYRYVNMDLGHALFNVALSAASLGFAAPVVARFDDENLAAFLQVDGKREAPLALVPLGRTLPAGAGAPLPPEPRFAPVSPWRGACEKGRTFADLIHGGTSFRLTGAWGFPRSRPEERSGPAAGGPARGDEKDIHLPEPARGDDLFPVIRRRRSVRKFSRAPLEKEELAALCVAARGPDAPPSDPFLSLSAPLNLHAVVRHVAGIPPGVYLFLPGTRSLRPLKEGDFPGKWHAACLGQDFCAAAAVLFVKTVRWNDLLAPDGDRGYRYACIRAGMTGEGLYLQATALRLGACGVGAFTDGDAAGLVGADPAREAVLYVTAVGK